MRNSAKFKTSLLNPSAAKERSQKFGIRTYARKRRKEAVYGMRKISLIDHKVERLKQKGAIVQVRSNRTSILFLVPKRNQAR